jgi:hypothetical protein
MSTQVLDTRDLIERRDELKEGILNSFLETFEHYKERTESFEDILFEEEEIQEWKEDWEYDLQEIDQIDKIECILGSEFEYGVTLVREDYWEEYVEDLLVEIGYLPKDLPCWIEIDWVSTAYNVKQDYEEVLYQGDTYLGRM